MRISDWSSDVCSSDLARADTRRLGPAYRATGARGFGGRKNRRNVGVTACRPACAFDCGTTGPQEWRRPSGRDDADGHWQAQAAGESGRGWSRERVRMEGCSWGGGVATKKQHIKKEK